MRVQLNPISHHALAGSEGRCVDLTPAWRFEPPEQQRQHGVDPRCKLRIAPFLGMGRMTQTTALLMPANTQPSQFFLPIRTVEITVRMQER